MADEEEQEQAQGHPAWQEILDTLNEIPEDFRTVVEPKLRDKLKEWDQGVDGKLQAVRSEYEGFEPYKPLIENNVPLENIQQALWLANKLEEDPKFVVDQAIKSFNLEYGPISQQPNLNADDENEDFSSTDLDDLENHPAYKALKERSEEIEKMLKSQSEREEEDKATQALRAELDTLHDKFDIDGPEGKKIPGFDDLYVAALMAQGFDPEDAVKSFNDTVNERARALAGIQQQQEEPPPVVMGGDGNTGSGIPKENIKMGNLGKGDLNQMVLDFLNNEKNQ